MPSRTRTIAACNKSVQDEIDSMTINARVDMDCVNRLGEHAARARAEMGEEKWAELQAEWETDDGE